MAAFKKILFEENPEGLIEIIVKICDEHTGRVIEVHPREKYIIMETQYVSVDSLEVGKQIELMSVKRKCTGLIKYPVAKVVELNKLCFHESDFEQAAKEAKMSVEFGDITYTLNPAAITRIDGILKQGEKMLSIWWDRTGSAFIGDLRIPEYDLLLSSASID